MLFMIRFINIVFLLFFITLSSRAQVKVIGTITDSSKNPLPSVIVKNINAVTKKMVGYVQSDANGNFTITAEVGSTIQIKALGYGAKDIVVTENMAFQNIVLNDDAVALKEVTVKADKVKILGDTIKYLLSTYAHKGDRTLADVLSRVPGFEVNKANGQISYDGKPISNFYIEGIDMLGGKYGTATNTLPQGDIAAVEVMKHHQPIRVLDEFTYSDNEALNIKMKNGAKAHWISTFNGSAGVKSKGGLWSFESLAMRIKPKWQMMLTYKTNNSGKEITKECENLLNLDDINGRLTNLISLPVAFSALGQRSLFNRSHAFTMNMLNKISDNSQVNLQMVYTNDRKEAWAQRTTEYYREKSNKIVDNNKRYLEKSNNLYTLLKYENNANNHYLKNTISGDLQWREQWLTETGTEPHALKGNIPDFTLKDNLYLIKKYGKHLVSFHSNNVMQVRPQHLFSDTIYQDINQHFYETNTYVQGGLNTGKFNLSASFGINAALYDFSSHLRNVPDSLGMAAGKSKFSFCQLYALPSVEYHVSDFNFQLLTKLESNYYKYSLGNGKSKYNVSPELHVKWDATPRLTLGLHGEISTEQVNVNQFFPALVLQDYEYINKGYCDYQVRRSKSVRLSVLYRNALKGVHFNMSVARSFDKEPYMSSRDFIDRFIVLSLLPEEAHEKSWNVVAVLSKGLSFLNGKLNARVTYNNTNSTIAQDGLVMPFNTYMLTSTIGFSMSLWEGMDFNYELSSRFNKMGMPAFNSSSALHNWKHFARTNIPLWQSLNLVSSVEYYHNQLTNKQFKDMCFIDMAFKYTTNHFDFALGVNNILNKEFYAYSINNDLVRSSSSDRVRDRELLLSVYYKP